MKHVLSLLIFLGMACAAFAQAPSITAVPNFHSMSLYWEWTGDLSDGARAHQCTVEWSDDGGTTWYPALDAYGDDQITIPNPNGRYVGRVFYLTPNTSYDFRMTRVDPDGGGPIVQVQQTATASTRNDVYPVGTVNTIGTRTTKLVITTADNGTAGGYTVFENGTITSPNPGGLDRLIEIQDNVEFVVIRNVTFTGGEKNCINFGRDTNDIFIEDCYMSGFGAVTANNDRQYSVYAPNLWNNAAIGGSTTWTGLTRSPGSRITIRNCEIVSDVAGSNDYEDWLNEKRAGPTDNQLVFNPPPDATGGSPSKTLEDGEALFTSVVDLGGSPNQIAFVVPNGLEHHFINAAEPLGRDDYDMHHFGIHSTTGNGEKSLGTGYETQATTENRVTSSALSYYNLYKVVSADFATKRIVAEGAFHGTDSGIIRFNFNAHPTGVHAVAFNGAVGQICIYNNAMYATEQKFGYNDVIGGSPNRNEEFGNLGSNSDVYQNYIANGNDNGLELEGMNENVAAWFNFVEKSRTQWGIAAVNQGPFWLFRNVSGVCKSQIENDTDATAWTKAGNLADGGTYFLLNTVSSIGSSSGLEHTDAVTQSGGGYAEYWYSRGNIYDTQGQPYDDGATATTHNLDADMSSNTIVATGNIPATSYDSISTGLTGSPPTGYILGTPIFASTSKYNFPNSDVDELDSGSPGYRDGYPLANVGMDATTKLTVSDPDMGALDPRMVQFIFGVDGQGFPTNGGAVGRMTATGTVTVGP